MSGPAKPSTTPSTNKSKPKQHAHSSHNPFRDNLLPYIESPSIFPSSIVLTYNDSFVLIHDKFPKSTIHLLLLPRDPARYNLHPFDALSDDPAFLAQVREEVGQAEELVASELRRRFGGTSEVEKERERAMDSEVEGDLPPGKDWRAAVVSGVHAVPSLHHLHIHILSRDLVSPSLKHKKHYNSFATGFFVPIADFPLAKGDVRRESAAQQASLQEAYVCGKCGRDFGNRFAQLKAHLEEEFETWKKI